MHIIAQQHEHLYFVQVGSRAYNYEQHFFNCAAYFFNYAALLHIANTRVSTSPPYRCLWVRMTSVLCARRWQVLGLLTCVWCGALEGSKGPALLLG